MKEPTKPEDWTLCAVYRLGELHPERRESGFTVKEIQAEQDRLIVDSAVIGFNVAMHAPFGRKP